MQLTKGQNIAVEQLNRISSNNTCGFNILCVEPPLTQNSSCLIDVAIDCSSIEKSQEGLPIRDNEKFIIYIPADFPFSYPAVTVPHSRFSGYPHVQWKRQLCLYQAPSIEWDPSDGMYGYIERLLHWLEQGALNKLDPLGAPLHPPIAYTTKAKLTIVPRENTPKVDTVPWFGTAHLKTISERRIDIVGWSEVLELNTPSNTAAAILLPTKMPFEFPANVSDLISELSKHNVEENLFYTILQWAILHNDEESPLYVVIGTAMRGIQGGNDLKQHLTVWEIEPVIAKNLRLVIKAKTLKDSIENNEAKEKIQAIADACINDVKEWSQSAKVNWCRVSEHRSEVVIRRDNDTHMSWFKGKTVSIWGVGALGSNIAENIVRAGSKKIILRDNKRVGPGILVRQNYIDSDIGFSKISCLMIRLKSINPDIEIDTDYENILTGILNKEDWTEKSDLIIDTTASNTVSLKLEKCWQENKHRTTTASLIVGKNSKTGILTFAARNYTGCTFDISRKLKIHACNTVENASYRDVFWPDEQQENMFQPEPGCSDPTFIGSHTDIQQLASTMLNQLAKDLLTNTDDSIAKGHFICTKVDEIKSSTIIFHSDIVINNDNGEIRIAPSCWRDINAWISRSKRINGENIETGGLLFGQFEESSGVIWVTEVIGPPEDSTYSEKEFLCGIRGTTEANNEKILRTRSSVNYIGMWHTHPISSAIPSRTDIEGMATILASKDFQSPKQLLMIVGNVTTTPEVGAYIFKRSDFIVNDKLKFINFDVSAANIEAPINIYPKSRDVGLALSGGGSRAVAFHLGCLRALHDLDMLKRIDVVSAVSGGSLITAMYAYSDDSFEDFEDRVIKFLSSGLMKDSAINLLFSKTTLSILFTNLTAGVAAAAAYTVRVSLSFIFNILRLPRRIRPDFIDKIQPFFIRKTSRTTAIRNSMRKHLGDFTLMDKRRDNLNVVFNACELRTGTAFRFGNRESGSWRFGKVLDNNIELVDAVSMSAAYPTVLPSIDKEYTFIDGENKKSTERVIITDGGVYDNLGVTCLEPDRSSEYGFNTYTPNYIFCCDAGAGQFYSHEIPYWWKSRMTRSFETTFKKVQDGTKQRLHYYSSKGDIKGFIYSYLGQIDKRLPWNPPDLISRNSVTSYPTDFSSMSKSDIELIADRGEMLTRLLISHYLT